MRTTYIFAALLLLLILAADQVYGAPFDASYGLNPARVWFVRPGVVPEGSVIVPRPDCGAAVVDQGKRPQLQQLHCARV